MIILSSPSGVGSKTTLKKIQQKYPNHSKYPVLHDKTLQDLMRLME